MKTKPPFVSPKVKPEEPIKYRGEALAWLCGLLGHGSIKEIHYWKNDSDPDGYCRCRRCGELV